MQYLPILLALSSAASAITIQLHSGRNCDNPNNRFFSCHNIGPNTCCSLQSSARFSSVSFSFIPTNWRIQTRAHGGGGCNTLGGSEIIDGGDWSCLRDQSGFATFSGGGYGFINTKRTAVPTEGECAVSEGECIAVRPDTYVAEDGGKYDLKAMPEAVYEELVALVFNDTSVADLPPAIKAFEIAA